MLTACVWGLSFWVGSLTAGDQEVRDLFSYNQEVSDLFSKQRVRSFRSKEPGDFVAIEMSKGRQSFVDLSRFVRNQNSLVWQLEDWDVLNQLVNSGTQQVFSVQCCITMAEAYDKLLKLVIYMSGFSWLIPDQSVFFQENYNNLKDIYFCVFERLESALSSSQEDLSLLDFRRHCFLQASYLSMFVSDELGEQDKVFDELVHKQLDHLVSLVDFQCFDCDLGECLRSVRPKDHWLIEEMWHTCQERKNNLTIGNDRQHLVAL